MTERKKYKFLLAGGGTGGHIFPAVSIARELKRRLPSAEILFVGANGRMEMEKVPRAGFSIEGIPIAGFQRKKLLKNLGLPFKILAGLFRAYKIIDRFKPDVVIGTGGYVSLPVVLTAQLKGIPTYIQEQNSYAGITNKILAKKARKIFTAYPEAEKFFPAGKVMLTGNPVRTFSQPEFPKEKILKKWQMDPALPVVFVMGGSLGARAINDAVKKMVTENKDLPFNLLWQTGKLYYERLKHLETGKVKIVPFIENMDEAYALADLVVSRAGAGTISELAVMKKPVILIPSPNVAEDHQTRNARALAANGAAIFLKEEELERLPGLIEEILNDKERIKKLQENIAGWAKPRATQEIVDEILKSL